MTYKKPDKKLSDKKVCAFPPKPSVLIAEIRERAQNRNKVAYSDHAFDRQEERSGVVELTIEDAQKVLRLGEIEGSPEEGENPGEWKVLVTFRPKGSRKIGVVTVVLAESDELLIITVMWRDA